MADGSEENDRLFLVNRLLDQNDKLIAALVASSPVEIVRALNPPVAPPAPSRDPWGLDVAVGEHRAAEDPWGDPTIPFDKLQPPREGWVDPPFVAEEPDATASSAER